MQSTSLGGKGAHATGGTLQEDMDKKRQTSEPKSIILVPNHTGKQKWLILNDKSHTRTKSN